MTGRLLFRSIGGLCLSKLFIMEEVMNKRIQLNDAMVWGESQEGHAKVLRDEVSRLQALESFINGNYWENP